MLRSHGTLCVEPRVKEPAIMPMCELTFPAPIGGFLPQL